MESSDALAAFAALAQPTRLAAFRRLVACEPDGSAAGDLAAALGVPANTMSAHFTVLAQAGLVRSERRGRTILYRADLDRFRALVLFMLRDCCGGRADVCAPLIQDLTACSTKECIP